MLIVAFIQFFITEPPIIANERRTFHHILRYYSQLTFHLLVFFSLLTISTMPNAETAKATMCSANSGLIATPRPDKRPIKPRHVVRDGD